MLFALLLTQMAHAAPDLTIAAGLRSTLSTFDGGDWQRPGNGTGGQLRVQLGDRVGTEWFLDALSADLPDRARRNDTQIGWSLMFYPTTTQGYEKTVIPYLIAGHCFDRTQITTPAESAARWSSAVQMGAGTHINLSERVDLSPTAQYMMHLGNTVALGPNGGVHAEKSGAFEGHLLVNLSANVRLVMPHRG